MTNQGRTTIFFLTCLLVSAGCLAKNGQGGRGRAQFGVAPPSAPGNPPAAAIQQGRAGTGSTRGRIDLRNPPPLDRSRKINEVDCSKPVDPSAGNLRCK